MLPRRRSTVAGAALDDNMEHKEGRKAPMTESLQLKYDSDSRHFRVGFEKDACWRQAARAETLGGEMGSEEQLREKYERSKAQGRGKH
jgi:hypothetical protein